MPIAARPRVDGRTLQPAWNAPGAGTARRERAGAVRGRRIKGHAEPHDSLLRAALCARMRPKLIATTVTPPPTLCSRRCSEANPALQQADAAGTAAPGFDTAALGSEPLHAKSAFSTTCRGEWSIALALRAAGRVHWCQEATGRARTGSAPLAHTPRRRCTRDGTGEREGTTVEPMAPHGVEDRTPCKVSPLTPLAGGHFYG